MKHPLLLIILGIVLMVPLAQAQQFYGGILGGINIADFDLDYYGRASQPDVKTQTFYGGGIVLGVRLIKCLSLQLEPMYQTFGGRYTESAGADMKVRMSVLEVPLFIKADLYKNFRPYIMAGPILNLKLDSEVEANISGLAFKGDLNPMLRDRVLGLGFGGGISMPIWKGWLFFENRYSFNLGNFNKGGKTEVRAFGLPLEIDANPKDKLKFVNTQFMLGYSLPLGGK